MPSLNEKRAFIQTAIIQLACRPIQADYDGSGSYLYMIASDCKSEAEELWDEMYPEEQLLARLALVDQSTDNKEEM